MDALKFISFEDEETENTIRTFHKKNDPSTNVHTEKKAKTALLYDINKENVNNFVFLATDYSPFEVDGKLIEGTKFYYRFLRSSINRFIEKNLRANRFLYEVIPSEFDCPVRMYFDLDMAFEGSKEDMVVLLKEKISKHPNMGGIFFQNEILQKKE